MIHSRFSYRKLSNKAYLKLYVIPRYHNILRKQMNMIQYSSYSKISNNKKELLEEEQAFSKSSKYNVDKKLLIASFIFLGSLTSILFAIHQIYQDGQDEIKKKTYLPLSTPGIKRRYNSGGSAGAAITVEAFTVGDEVTPEELFLRYSFDEPDSENNLRSKQTSSLTSESNHSHIKKKKNLPNAETMEMKSKAIKKQNLKHEIWKKRKFSSRFTRIVGEGTFGRVVCAIDRRTGKKVALKIVPYKSVSAEAFHQEIEVLNRVCGHENIIDLKGFFYCNGNYYLVTEFCEGGELLDRITVSDTFNESEASKLIYDVTKAIQHIHKCGYVHLDIKPENLVFSSKSGHNLRVIDFGMTKKISEVMGKLSMISDNKSFRIGTMPYWSPEQVASVIDSDGHLLGDVQDNLITSDPRACDMWALGVVLYIILLGCHPFDPYSDKSQHEIAKAIQECNYSFDIVDDDVQLSDDAKDLIKKLLDPNPSTRLSSREVLFHPFIVKYLEDQKNSSAQPLINRWLQNICETSPDKNKKKSNQAFLHQMLEEAMGRSLLMAIASLVNHDDFEKERKFDITIDNLFLKSFKMFGAEKNGYLTKEMIEKFLFSTDEFSSVKVRKLDILNSIDSSFPKLTGNLKTMKEKKSLNLIDFDDFKSFFQEMNCQNYVYPKNEIIFEKSSFPIGFFILLKGKVQVKCSNKNDDKNFISKVEMKPGTLFGLMDFFSNSDNIEISARCLEPSEIMFIPKEILLQSLASSPALKSVLLHVITKQQNFFLNKLVKDYKHKDMTKINLNPGDILFKQNSKAESLYFIQSGQMMCSSKSLSSCAMGAEPIVVNVQCLGPGEIIGSTVGSINCIRKSTATCLSPVSVFRISLDDAIKMFNEMPLFRLIIVNMMNNRIRNWCIHKLDIERGLTEQQLFPLFVSNFDLTDSSGANFNNGTNDIEVITKINNLNKSESQKNISNEKINQKLLEKEVTNQSNILEKISSLRKFSDMIKTMKMKNLKKGDYVFKAGEKPEKFYMVFSGSLVVEYVNTSGDTLAIAQFNCGDHFGDIELIENAPKYNKSVRCLTDAKIMSMKKNIFQNYYCDGKTEFGEAINYARKLRAHIWTRNILKLLKEDRRNRLHSRRNSLTEKLRLLTSKNANFKTFDENSKDSVDHEKEVYSNSKKGIHTNFRMVLQPGDCLFRQGEFIDNIYMVHRGKLALTKTMNEITSKSFSKEKPKAVEELVEGNTWGLDIIGSGVKNSHTAICVSPNTIVSKINISTLDKTIENYAFISPKLQQLIEQAAPLHEIQKKTEVYFGGTDSFLTILESDIKKR